MIRHLPWSFLLVAAPMAAQILVPAPDEIVTTPTIVLQGRCPANATVVLDNGLEIPPSATVTGEAWELANVPLQAGINTVTVNIDDTPHTLTVTHAVVPPSAPQKIRFNWISGVDASLRQIAVETLCPIPSAEEQSEFVTAVRNRTEQLTEDAFAGVANVVLTSTHTADTHTVAMTTAKDFGYGVFQPSPDCLNETPNDVSKVSVAYLAKRIADDFGAWAPMEPADSIAVRIEDVAQTLARTAVHEIAHSLGLVGAGGDCGWMLGNGAGHTNPGAPRGVVRSAAGAFVMDHARESYHRLGYLNKKRTPKRLPLFFCNFNRSYLRLLLP